MRLTPENASQYEGKILDSSRKLFHYYPISPLFHSSLGWCFVDRFGTMQKIPDDGVFFDEVREKIEKEDK